MVVDFHLARQFSLSFLGLLDAQSMLRRVTVSQCQNTHRAERKRARPRALTQTESAPIYFDEGQGMMEEGHSM